MGRRYFACYRFNVQDTNYESMYIYSDGTAHRYCKEGGETYGWFDSHEEAEKAVRLFLKKEKTPVPTKPIRGIIATWLYNLKNKE